MSLVLERLTAVSCYGCLWNTSLVDLVTNITIWVTSSWRDIPYKTCHFFPQSLNTQYSTVINSRRPNFFSRSGFGLWHWGMFYLDPYKSFESPHFGSNWKLCALNWPTLGGKSFPIFQYNCQVSSVQILFLWEYPSW